MSLRVTLSLLAGIAISIAAGSAASAADAVKIGTKNFTEQFIVAEVYAQALEKAGITVERHLNLGATLVAQTALTHGDIDLYPESNG